jgi:hypothetical protein
MGIFIWTEAFNCGEILNPMLSSYIKHNSWPIHVFGSQTDLDNVTVESNLIILENVNKKKHFQSIEKKIINGYKKGHKGTAILWEYIINSRSEKIFVHLDADTIFLDDVVTDLINAIQQEGYSIAGSRRAYKKRSYRKEGKDGMHLNLRPDCVNTDCFAFTTEYVRRYPRCWLRRKIQGKRVSLKPVVDFFDPVTFEIIKRHGKIKYMDSPNDGFSSLINYNSKFMTSRISFAAVGSGCNFYKNGHKGIPSGYREFALASYSLFAKEFLNKEISIEPLEDKAIFEKISRLNKSKWILE